ncbi:MAG: restriction endonuclease subunit S [Arcobacter sp.]|nr:MAG: restriction endonuclease subunit S [Arcobacter sp.]
MDFKNIKWKHFKVNDLFEIEKCKCKKAGDLEKGLIPYIGATNKNNGIMNFVDHNDKLQSKGNKIVFICDGQGSVGYSIYKYEDFIGSTTLKTGSNKNLNKFNGLFLTTSLDMNKTIYDYGYKRNDGRLKNETINLPTKNKKPDFELMEKYSKQLLKNKLDKYKKYIEDILNKIEYKEIDKLENKEWKEFFLTEIFTQIQRGKRLTKANQIKGAMPYVSSSGANNGVDNYIGNKEKVRIFSNCLSLANSGSVGASFYHSYEFVASDHITHLKNEDFNEYIYLFISTLTSRLSGKYNFNREINDKRISREKILLPINNKEEPDYHYMAQYIINMKYKKIKQYLTFKEK